jgi:hypothetical protein
MSRNATQTVVQPKVQPRPAASGKGNNANLSREAIADHLADFRKKGGRIEILGTTPLRASVPPASRSKTAAKPAAAKAPAAATGKTAG